MYHKPVMLPECLDGLEIKPNGIYVDVTFGGGGHSKAILERLTIGKLIAFDQDPDAKQQAVDMYVDKVDKNFLFIQANFRHLSRFLRVNRIDKVDGILADLGISSHQIDTAQRGFSTRFDAQLDMRMSQDGQKTAQTIINAYSEADLHRILGMYGELQNAKTAAKVLCTARANKPIETIEHLKTVLSKLAPRGKEHKYFAQVFQALRIEVNEEMEALQEFLQQVPDVLNPEGRLVVMSYHSLEDRLVKNYINKGKFFGEIEKDFYGNDLKPLQSINRKPIEASPEEIAENPRARSAKLRIATSQTA